ncbi:MAG TPA: polysaccharide deacetylase family protein [Streptosporangiaceae bacterium]
MRKEVELAVRLRAGWPLPLGPAVAVLGWHRLDTEGGKLAVPPAVFARQMQILTEHRQHFPVLRLEAAGSVLTSGRRRSRAVVLTFDDAWADNHAYALGPLTDHQLPATLYAPSRLLGRPGYMTKGQLLEMAASGITIGAHSRTHCDLRACGTGELEGEVQGSKDDLEDLIGGPVTSFAYPAGLLDRRVEQAVRSAGFTSAVTSDSGWWRPSSAALRIPRSFAEDFSDATWRAAIAGGLNALGPLDAIKRAGRRR